MPRPEEAEGIAPKPMPVRAPAGSSDPAWDPTFDKLQAGLPARGSRRRRKAGACFGPKPGERMRFALLSNRGEGRGFAFFRSQAKREGSPSRGAARRGGGSRPKSLPTGSAGAFALRARPTGAERGFASLRNPPTQRVIARPRRRDREPGTSGAGGDAGPHVVWVRSGASSRVAWNIGVSLILPIRFADREDWTRAAS
ncbi:MAG: hypothetical protein QOE79_258 [Sphingomonadales bacterium]|jgi:hypothetical protein|nr:hypothetical protein [Sphingomonadales bacterium]